MHFIRLPMILLSSCYTVPSTLVKGIWDWVVNYLWYYLYASHSFHSFHSIEWWCPSHLPRVCSVKAWSENVLSLLHVCASHLSYFLGISEILFVLLRRAVNPPKHETARSICFSCQNVFFFVHGNKVSDTNCHELCLWENSSRVNLFDNFYCKDFTIELNWGFLDLYFISP